MAGIESYGLAEDAASTRQDRLLKLQKDQREQEGISQLPQSLQPYARAGVDPKIGVDLEQAQQGRTLNQQTAAAIVQYAGQARDPTTKNRLNVLASIVANSPKAVDGDKIFEALNKGDVDAATLTLRNAQIPEAQAYTQQALASAARQQAQTAMAGPVAQSQIARNLAEATRAQTAPRGFAPRIFVDPSGNLHSLPAGADIPAGWRIAASDPFAGFGLEGGGDTSEAPSASPIPTGVARTPTFAATPAPTAAAAMRPSTTPGGGRLIGKTRRPPGYYEKNGKHYRVDAAGNYYAVD